MKNSFRNLFLAGFASNRWSTEVGSKVWILIADATWKNKAWLPGADPGGPGPLFLAKSILFFTLYTMSENIFLEVWGMYACVCVCLCDPTGLQDKSVVFLSNIGGFRNRGRYCFLFAKAQFWMISEAILIPKIYARLQEIASNFSKFSGGGPQTPRQRSRLRRSVRALPPYRPPFPKFLDPPLSCDIFTKIDLDLALG